MENWRRKKNVVIVITSITTVLSFLPAKVIPDGAPSAFRKMFVESTASFDAFQFPIWRQRPNKLLH